MNKLLRIKSFFDKFIKNKQGVTAIEYAIMVAGVAVIVVFIFKGQSGYSVYDMFYDVFIALKSKLLASV